jgi:hypothetical protein
VASQEGLSSTELWVEILTEVIMKSVGLYSGVWHRVVYLIGTNVSEEPAASIFR